ncbi:drug/metabolite transporter (DMT)-like permease [Amycolatopsis endophytica]|uniref:Drug/metabolite transporter (DMT)-like permease n=1 Tax=Amycolatopsis endophytica TaxID=860233 RepID=A0A853B6E3_9PSEU|nr:DMT family transporter [Amycolatopsis endophytica]NYI90334.1 drug/metabolite transporter (DMT)-like permease [Amycolatopsis endophytica]
MWWGLLCAVAAAVAYGTASVFQAVAARAVDEGTSGVDPRLLVRVLRQWRFVLGVGLDVAGFAAQLAALRVLPLFLVQATLAASLAVTAVAALRLGARLSGREWTAVALVCAGLAVLGFAAASEGSDPVGTGFRVGLLLVTAALAAAGWITGRATERVRTPALGLVSGLCFGVVALAGRVLEVSGVVALLTDPAAYAVAAAGVLAMLFYTSALQRGSVTTATALMVVGETVVPSLIGVLVLGDSTRPGFAPVAVAGFVLAVAAALALARFGEIDSPQGSDERHGVA